MNFDDELARAIAADIETFGFATTAAITTWFPRLPAPRIPMPPDDPNLQRLCSEIVADVESRVASRGPTVAGVAPGGAVSLPMAGLSLSATLPQLARIALDLAVDLLGDKIEGIVEANRDEIKAILSDSTVAFVDGIVHRLGPIKVGR